MAAENGKAYKKLKMAEIIKGGEWIRQHWEELRDNPPTYAALATRMSASLGFDVPLGSVPSLIEACGYKWPETVPAVGHVRKPTGRTVILARAIRDLYEKAGEPCPLGVKAICNSTPLPADPERPLLG